MSAEITMAELPRDTSPEQMDRIMGAMDRLQARAVEAAKDATTRACERRAELAMDEQRRKLIAASGENYRAGRNALSTLECDEYRDTSAVLAEVRTRVFAARLSYVDEDAAWTIKAIIRRFPGGPARVLEKEVLTQQAAWDFYNDVVERFYRTSGFVCRVNY